MFEPFVVVYLLRTSQESVFWIEMLVSDLFFCFDFEEVLAKGVRSGPRIFVKCLVLSI